MLYCLIEQLHGGAFSFIVILDIVPNTIVFAADNCPLFFCGQLFTSYFIVSIIYPLRIATLLIPLDISQNRLIFEIYMLIIYVFNLSLSHLEDSF